MSRGICVTVDKLLITARSGAGAVCNAAGAEGARMTRVHPLEPLTADEIEAAVAAVRATGRVTEAARFSTITLDEPPKEAIAAFDRGETVERRVRLLIVPSPECAVVEAIVDMARGVVLEVVDYGVVPIPEERGSYYPEDNEPQRTDLRPLEITQPQGPSFTVEGNLVRWQKWSLRVSMDPVEGLVLHTVGYEDGGRVRPILHRASICEMVVPYGDPGPMHSWKNAFDAGEWGLGRMANSLALGCDCLGEIRYFDVVTATEQGQPSTLERAICMHEEDYGILWKHIDLQGGGRVEVRRSRRLVISSIATVGNYEYGFYWYFYLDGSMQLEVKLTGIMSTKALAPNERSPISPPIAPGLAAPVH